jgi:hypothetical protein
MLLWTRVCDRVTGLARGKAAGSTFLSLPMVKGGVGIRRYSRYLCLLTTSGVVFDNFLHAFILSKPHINRVNYKYSSNC